MGSIACSRNTSFAFFLISYILFIIAYSTPFWYGLEVAGIDVIQGLWLICSELLNDCKSIGDASSTELKWTQAMESIAVFIYTASLVTYCVWMGKNKLYLKRHGAGAIGISSLVLALLGGVFSMIGVVIYGAHHVDNLFEIIEDIDSLYFHASFVCACLTAIAHLANSIITLFAMLCCCKADQSSEHIPADGITVNNVTVAYINEPQFELPVQPAATPQVAQPAGYPQPGLYPNMGGYPQVGGYPQTGGVPSHDGNPTGKYLSPTAPTYEETPPRYSSIMKDSYNM